MFHCKTVTEEEAGVNMKVGRTRTETTDPTMHHMLTPRKFQVVGTKLFMYSKVR